MRKEFSTDDIGEYFSALANQANYVCCPVACLGFWCFSSVQKKLRITARAIIHLHCGGCALFFIAMAAVGIFGNISGCA